MFLKKFYLWFNKPSQLEYQHQIKELKTKVRFLEKQVVELTQQLQPEKELQPPIVVENVFVDKVVLDTVEFNNNFGALNVKDLSGRLNIGANYGMGMPPFRPEQGEPEAAKKATAKKAKAEAKTTTAKESKAEAKTTAAKESKAKTAAPKAAKARTQPKCSINYAAAQKDR